MFFVFFFPVCVLVGAVGLAIKSTEVCVAALMSIALGSLQWPNQNNETKNNEELCRLRALEADLIKWDEQEKQCMIQME